jgi:hypothetical protein
VYQRTLVAFFSLALAGSPSLALETAEVRRADEARLAARGSVVVENLLGSVRIVASADKAVARIEARAVAEAKTPDEARALAESIRIERETEGADVRFRVVFPVEQHAAFRPPKGGVKGWIGRWTGSMFRETREVDYGGRRVQVGTDRKAAGLAVDVTVTVPHDWTTTVRQRAGTVEGRALRGDLRIVTTDGEVAVERCLGRLAIDAQHGRVRVAAFQGEALTLELVEGEVELSDVRAAAVRLRTDSGAIHGSGVSSDELAIESGSGVVELGAVEPRSARVRTISGRVDLATYMRALRDAVIHSDSGDVVLRVGELTHFDLRAESKSGEVKTLGGVGLDLVAQDGLAQRLRHGQGGVDVQVSAPGGGVTVRPYDGSRLELLARD